MCQSQNDDLVTNAKKYILRFGTAPSYTSTNRDEI